MNEDNKKNINQEIINDYKNLVRWRYNTLLWFKKAELNYYAEIAALKWDIWYYYTGIQLIITCVVGIAVIMGFIYTIFVKGGEYIDPFKAYKTASYVISFIGIGIIFLLNQKFIDVDAKRDDMEKVLKRLIIFSTLTFGIIIITNVLTSNYINENINIFYEVNSISKSVDMEDIVVTNFLEPFTLKDKTMYNGRFYIITFIEYIVMTYMIINNMIWTRRLKKQKNVIEKTEILFDEEENVKF